MWIFTKYGFLNAVGARQGNGSHGQPVDPDTMMIRARLLPVTATELSQILGGVALSAKRQPRYAKPEKSSATIEIPSHVWSRSGVY